MKAHVAPGIDNLRRISGLLEGKRLGLMTHTCGYDSGLTCSIDILNDNYKLTALFGCEHGIRGDIQDALDVEDEIDSATGVHVYTLYGKTMRPTREMLDTIDVFLVDIQDIGIRFYTYIYTMAYAMDECARYGKTFVVLDRIDPLGGIAVQGTMLDERFHSFVGEYAVPTRYALTIGEFALYIKEHLSLDLDLHIVPVSGWKRDMLWEDTDCVWTSPSPNMPTPHTALTYTGTCIFEGTNISEGRGTTTPFEIIGAPFIDADKLCQRMRSLDIRGMGFLPARFIPTFSKWENEVCRGVRVYSLHPDSDAFSAGLLLLETILDMYPNEACLLPGSGHLYHLLGTDEFPGNLSACELIRKHRPLIEDFAMMKKRWHIYH